MNSCIYSGRVSHQRLQPKPHGFNYNLFMMYLDLDELPRLFKPFFFWSSTGPALAWFRREDHMGDHDKPLAQSIRELILTETGKEHTGPIRLLTHLRYFGYCMNPVSFYYCWDKDNGRLEHIVAEVHNTPWAETHCYVLDCHDVGTNRDVFQFRFDKQFHVSPFMSMHQNYEWSLSTPGNQLLVNMNTYENEVKMFNASMQMQRQTINHFSMTKTLLAFPCMTAKVVAAIYWQALNLWVRKIPFHSHPKKMNPEQL
ncbi:MAG: DUF1365 family protein [Gammaproteobacteria bacterium]|jgi:DUF1365 family protein